MLDPASCPLYCLALGPLWDMACLLLHWLLTQHIHVSRETCFSLYFGDDRNDENSQRMQSLVGMHTRGADSGMYFEIQKLKASANPAAPNTV